MIRKILPAKTHSGRLIVLLIIIKKTIFSKQFWFNERSCNLCLCVSCQWKRGVSHIWSRGGNLKRKKYSAYSNHHLITNIFFYRVEILKLNQFFLHLCFREREKYLRGMKIYECFIYYNITLCLVARCWVVWKAIIDGRRRLFVSEAIISHTSALLHSLHFFISIFLYLHFFPFHYFYISIFAYLCSSFFLKCHTAWHCGSHIGKGFSQKQK